LTAYDDFSAALKSKNTPHIVVIAKSDVPDSASEDDLPRGAIGVSVYEPDTIDVLKEAMVRELSAIKNDDETLIGDLLPPGSTVLMVVPIDSAAPKGRLILPQVQLIRDCLDNGITAFVSTVDTLANALENIQRIDLVVTDSQVFAQVAEIIPREMKLTSFSILMARQKGDIEILHDGINAIKTLKNGDRVLVSEVCTHSRTHEDIGQVKIPNALRKITDKNIDIDFAQGRDYPIKADKYTLIIHCAGCMITPKEMQSRIDIAREAKTPITNYGLFLAHVAGVLERSIEILH